jgi:hypothetical protein
MENTYEDLLDVLSALKVWALMHRAGLWTYEGSTTALSEDCYYVVCDALYGCFSHAESDYDEKNDEYSYFFSDRCFADYYKLSRKYGKRNQIPFYQNPYVRRAELYVDEMLHGPYTCAHNLRVKRHKPGLHFYHCSEFYYEVQLIEQLLNIRRFFLNGIEELKVELKKSPPLKLSRHSLRAVSALETEAAA